MARSMQLLLNNHFTLSSHSSLYQTNLERIFLRKIAEQCEHSILAVPPAVEEEEVVEEEEDEEELPVTDEEADELRMMASFVDREKLKKLVSEWPPFGKSRRGRMHANSVVLTSE